MGGTAQVPRAHRARARTILARLEDIDRASVRPARAVASGYGTPDDEAAIRALEEEAIALRAELRAYLPPYPEPTSPPEVIVPQRITARQARLALLEAGFLDDVEAIIDALPANVRAQVRIEWDRATHVERGSQVTQMVATALGLTAAQVDDLFVAAAGL